jgi:hypothetical protein
MMDVRHCKFIRGMIVELGRIPEINIKLIYREQCNILVLTVFVSKVLYQKCKNKLIYDEF